jgi:hypothetical protein
MLESRLEYACRTIDVSASGIALAAPMRGEIGERAVLYLDHLGRIEGKIARYIEPGFVLAIQASTIKRDRLVEQLSWLATRTAQDLDRRHERIVPYRQQCILVTEDGQEVVVRIANVSVSGAAITTELKLPVKSRVTLGQTPGHVVRYIENGLVIGFESPVPIDRFNENLTL